MRSFNERINVFKNGDAEVESHPGPPTTPGNEGTSHVLLIVWCNEYDTKGSSTAGVAARWDDETPVPDRREHLAFPRCTSRRVK
jgi:hypothetical protein